jgi:prepilin-type N-terminal cleavage/methylation domain-containing protein
MRRSFTLLELLIVLVIVAILFVIALPIYNMSVINLRKAEAELNLNTLFKAVEAYYLETGNLPATVPPDFSIPAELGIKIVSNNLSYTYDGTAGGVSLHAYIKGFTFATTPAGTICAYTISIAPVVPVEYTTAQRIFGGYYRVNWLWIHKGGGIFEFKEGW